MPERIVIHQIDVENFKSYLGRHTIGPFNTSFSCIIGPNGSGKSNIIDALLFVFGFKARNMRMKKVEELIYTGKGKEGVLEATVTIHFVRTVYSSGAPRAKYIRETHFTVSRTVRRGKQIQSTYRVNDKVSTLENITKLLKETHNFDVRNNRFMILQGEVEAIATMKAKGNQVTKEEGLLEFIEGMIGTDVYIESIEQCEKELEVMMEDRQSKLFAARVVQGERTALAPGRNEALIYLEKQKELVEHKGRLYIYHMNEEEEEQERIEQEVEECIQKLEELKEQVKELKVQKAKTNKEYEGKKKQYDASEIQQKKIKDEMMKVTNQSSECDNEMKESEKLIVKLGKEIQKLEKARDGAESELKTDRETAEQLDKQLEEKNKVLQDLQSEMKSVQSRVKGETAVVLKELNSKKTELRSAES
ncbi:MAG: putative Structural maintenance of chromosomes protein 4 [Streblomastix strix]|uniref:Putative Structural maintenance of chromosomes protein 4 n=1 Tax=Streblomastix strix TaxID=222440 RepID=A0A5J4WXD7_9EUKA|nr:MAG: putative Structural maintenance of chromosomes protein 4 [Streblomastix strix]